MGHEGLTSKVRSWAFPGAVALGVGLLPACATATPEGVARTRAANDFHCSEGDIKLTNIGGTSYRASGCEQEGVYDCANVVESHQYAGLNYVCLPEGSNTSSGEHATKEEPAADPGADPDEGTPRGASLCVKAYQRIGDLTSAWGEWHSQRKAKGPPSRLDFLNVCHQLSGKQQMCLLMPYGRDYRVNCAKTLGALSDELTQQLDDLFLEP